MDIPKKRGRGRPKNTPVDVVSGWARQKIAESEVDRQIDKLMKIMELKMMENSLKIPPPSPPPIEKEEEKGDFLHLKGRMGSNNYDINITTMEDQRMAASLLNQFGIYLIRKDH